MTQRAVTKSVELVAWRFNGEAIDQLPDWVARNTIQSSAMGLTFKLSDKAEVMVPRGAWVLQEADGTLAACSHETFHQRYQLLSADINSVQLGLHMRMFQPGSWNPAMVERASVAFHNADTRAEGWMPWDNLSDADKEATRLAIRKALTAAISTNL